MNVPAPQEFGRHSIRLNGYDYSQAGGYFVTIVTHGRACLFGEIQNGGMQLSDIGRIADENWCAIPEHFPNVELGEFVVMPNHVHGIIITLENNGPTKESPSSVEARYADVGARYISPLPAVPYQPRGCRQGSVGAIVASYKAALTRWARREFNSGNIWQRNYYEHIIRSQADYERIAAYILDNPLNWNQDDENPQNPAVKGNAPA